MTTKLNQQIYLHRVVLLSEINLISVDRVCLEI